MQVVADIIFWWWHGWIWVFLAWQIAYGMRPEGRIYDLLAETKTLFQISTVFKMAITDPVFAEDALWVLPIYWAIDLLWLWITKNFGDDRWKKRRKKAAAKVKEVAGRLVVVPELAPVTGK